MTPALIGYAPWMPGAAPLLPPLHPSLSWAGPLFALRRHLGARWPGLVDVDGLGGPVAERLVAEIAPQGRGSVDTPVQIFDGVDGPRRIARWLSSRRDQQHAVVPVNPPSPLLVFHDVDEAAYAAILAWEEEVARLAGLGPDDVIPDVVRIEGDAAGKRDAAGRIVALAITPTYPVATLCTGPLVPVLHRLTRLEYDQGVEEARVVAARGA